LSLDVIESKGTDQSENKDSDEENDIKTSDNISQDKKETADKARLPTKNDGNKTTKATARSSAKERGRGGKRKRAIVTNRPA
jgi:hypothetical protein